MSKTITKAKLDDAVKTGGMMGDVVFTIKKKKKRHCFHYKVKSKSSQIQVCFILNGGSYNSVSFAVLSVWCWLFIMTLHVIFPLLLLLLLLLLR